jgi:hypothetical protein
MICRTFPYSIYYKISGSDVQVYAVLDDRRDPVRNRRTLDDMG